MSEKPASLGAEIIDGETFPYWTERVRQVWREESAEVAARPLVVIDAADVAERIDFALSVIERTALRKCIEIAEQEGAWNTATRIRTLLQELGKGLIQESQPEPALPDNPLTVKVPV